MKLAAIAISLFITCQASAQPQAKILQKMENYTADSTAIAETLTNIYFKGIYAGDVDLLKTIYFDGTLLFGDVKGQPYYKTLAQYLDGVKNRQSPKDSGKPFDGQIQGIQITNSIAVARVQVKMYDFNYSEFLSFHKFDGKWLIVNKMISDISQ
jgi:Putative lumazine-binding